jgi:hypothetical protein
VRRFGFVVPLALSLVTCRPDTTSSFVLRIAVPGPLEALSATTGSGYTTAAQDLIFDTFLVPDQNGALTSRVLRRWERVDGRRYRVQLEPNLHFSDGRPVGLDDVIASLAAQKLRGMIQGEWLEIEPIDANRLVEPALLYAVLYKQTPTGFVGTGAYRLVSESPTEIALERIRPLPHRISRVEVVAYPTPREVLARVIRGDTNAALGLDERQLELMEGIRRLKPIRGLSHTALSVIFNTRRLDSTARRQLASSLPVRDIAGVFAAGCRAEDTAGTRLEYRPLRPGRRLEVLAPRAAVPMERTALAVRRALGTRGGEVVQVETPELIRRSQAGAFDVMVAPIVNWPDAAIANVWRTDAPYNVTRYSNSRVDAAFDRGDTAGAKAELAADVPYISICRRERIGVVDSRIKNARMGWWGILDTLSEWEVDE